MSSADVVLEKFKGMHPELPSGVCLFLDLAEFGEPDGFIMAVNGYDDGSRHVVVSVPATRSLILFLGDYTDRAYLESVPDTDAVVYYRVGEADRIPLLSLIKEVELELAESHLRDSLATVQRPLVSFLARPATTQRERLPR